MPTDSRRNHMDTSKGSTTPLSSSADIDSMIANLRAAGWTPKSATIWCAPNGTLHMGPAGAYRTMMGDRYTVASTRDAIANRGWPAGKSTDLVIAERMLASALYNYNHARMGGDMAKFTTWDALSDAQASFYAVAVQTAARAIWGHQ